MVTKHLSLWIFFSHDLSIPWFFISHQWVQAWFIQGLTPTLIASCPQEVVCGHHSLMNIASSQVDWSSDKFCHIIFHCVMISSLISNALVSRTDAGLILMYPSVLVKGKSFCGIAFGPMCWLSWLTWKIGWMVVDAVSWSFYVVVPIFCKTLNGP